MFRRYGLGQKCGCFQSWCTSTEEGNDLIKRTTLTAQRKVKKEQNIQKRKEKEPFIKWRPKLQTTLQEIARIIDFGQKCLARKYRPGQMHGGHIFSKGGNSNIALNLHNIHRQSSHSNYNQSDDGLIRDNLEEEYGKEYHDFLKGLRKHQMRKISNLEFMEIYRHACKIRNRMKKQLKVNSLQDRIRLRNEVNFELGIYEKEHCIFK